MKIMQTTKTKKLANRALLGALASGLFVSAMMVLPTPAPAQAAKKGPKKGVIEPWAGQRVLLLLPLQLGEGFNADQNFGRAILPRAEEILQAQLQATGKFSVIQTHRFNPIIQRALQEKRLTEAQVTTLIETPTLENARALLSQFVFDRPAMIAEFRLEEVRAGSDAKKPSVQVQVSGRLYDMANPVAIKSPVITSAPTREGNNQIERFLNASQEAFADVAAEFVAPLEDIQFPAVEPTPEPAPATPVATPAAPAPAPAPAPNVTLPGDVPIAGSSTRGVSSSVPQLPAVQPPLGVTVPDKPTP